jgi:high-affinity Fe2+/Pb2+ permease
VTEEVFALVTEKTPETSSVVAFSKTKVATTFPLREGSNAVVFLAAVLPFTTTPVPRSFYYNSG